MTINKEYIGQPCTGFRLESEPIYIHNKNHFKDTFVYTVYNYKIIYRPYIRNPGELKPEEPSPAMIIL